jgi:signal peptidase I
VVNLEDEEKSNRSLDVVEKKVAKPSKLTETWEWTKALGIAVILATAIKVFLFAPVIVEGESMFPTLENKERLMLNKAAYLFSEPKRGEVVVFHSEHDKDWIKRVIGEPGDIVEVKEEQLFVNNKLIDEPYLDSLKLRYKDLLTEDFYIEVPKGHLFVMGDNRPNSRDSRRIGPIEIDQVIGRAEFVMWPLKEIKSVK